MFLGLATNYRIEVILVLSSRGQANHTVLTQDVKNEA